MIKMVEETHEKVGKIICSSDTIRIHTFVFLSSLLDSKKKELKLNNKKLEKITKSSGIKKGDLGSTNYYDSNINCIEGEIKDLEELLSLILI
jgi:hypothetical protein